MHAVAARFGEVTAASSNCFTFTAREDLRKLTSGGDPSPGDFGVAAHFPTDSAGLLLLTGSEQSFS